MLDYVKVKCVADIDLGMLSGTGRLIKIGLDQPGQAGARTLSSLASLPGVSNHESQSQFWCDSC